MHTNINEVEKELEELCIEYLNILHELREKDIITEEGFEQHSLNKIKFLNSCIKNNRDSN